MADGTGGVAWQGTGHLLCFLVESLLVLGGPGALSLVVRDAEGKAVAKLTIIVGMGGSGKSFLCEEIAKNSNAKAFKDATLTNNDRRRAGYDCLGEMVARLLGLDEDCVMDESHLTVPTFRDTFRDFCDEFLNGVEQEWIFFEHNVVACINNIFHDVQVNGRNELNRLKALEGQRKVYVVPPVGDFPGHRQPRSVYRQELPKFNNSQEAEAIDWLRGEIARLTR
jgi:hypothetical protein